ncbi:MAG TPA: hypothetical protein DHW45_07645 [Candidatus Latescibacteria bacterium]|nr:hypothetical protein [Candidatus Latescibacterota bacterium]
MIQPREGILSIDRLYDGPADDRTCRLDKNERIGTIAEPIWTEMMLSLKPRDLMAYPDLPGFRDRVSEWIDLPPDQILVTSGSDQAIKSVFEAFVSPGDEVLIPSPTFAMYHVYKQMFRAKGVEVTYGSDMSMPVEKLCKSIKKDTRLLALPNPNSPTGAIYKESDLVVILERARASETLVLIDEAYYPFSCVTALPLIRDYSNLLVTRTFSKAAGLAGARVGFACGNAHLIDALTRVRPMYEANGIALKLGTFVMKHPDIIDAYVAEVSAGKRFLKERFGRIGTAYPSEGNFQVARLPSGIPIHDLVSAVEDLGFRIKGWSSGNPMGGCIRITAGPVAVMESFWQAFETIWNLHARQDPS